MVLLTMICPLASNVKRASAGRPTFSPNCVLSHACALMHVYVCVLECGSLRIIHPSLLLLITVWVLLTG